MEADLTNKGIPLGTAGWPERAKHWWYGHGGKLHPETGKCMHRDKVFTPTQKLIDAMADAAAGKYRVDREKDELTRALGNAKKQDEYEAEAPVFRGRKGFPRTKTGTVTKVVRERRIGRQTRLRTFNVNYRI